MSFPRRWIAIVVAFLAVNMGATGMLIYFGGDPSARVIPHAYQRAIAFDQTLAANAASDALGWRIDARLTAIDAAHDRVTLALTDRAGRTIPGAEVGVAVRHESRATGVTARLVEERPGYYTGAVATQGRGLNAVEVTAAVGVDRFTAARSITRVEVAP